VLRDAPALGRGVLREQGVVAVTTDYVAFLRGISNVPMEPYRAALVDIGLTDVRSFGGTGNMLFRAGDSDRAALEESIAEAVGVETFVRSRSELAAVVSENPYTGRPGAGVFFARGPIDASQVAALMAGGFDGEPPVVAGSEVYFVHPLSRPGHKSIIDFERVLGVRGTMRAARVVARVLELM
jgi:uncharacterized protein (DUF1697 family)